MVQMMVNLNQLYHDKQNSSTNIKSQQLGILINSKYFGLS